jgi:carbonic anhydrase
MESPTTLQTIVGDEKALVISCQECHATDFYSENVITLLTPCNCVNPHHHDLKKEIRSCIEKMGCTRLIVAGHTDCKMLFQSLASGGDEASSSRDMLAGVVIDNRQGKITHSGLRNYCIELNVLEQVETIMSYHFVRQLVDEGALTVSGVVLNPETHQARELVRNGWNFNSIRSLN